MKINPIGHLVKTNPNKANFRKAQMNVNSLIAIAKDYRKNDAFTVQKNKPKTNPIKPNPPARYAIRNTRYEIQTQSNPISKGVPMLLCGALLRTSFTGMTILKISVFSVAEIICSAGLGSFFAAIRVVAHGLLFPIILLCVCGSFRDIRIWAER